MIGMIIQARMASTRLPGKVMLPLNNVPMLQFQIERLKKSKYVDKFIIATSKKIENRQIRGIARKIGIEHYLGNEEDVLDRYYQTAKKFKLDTIVRITGDCPLHDPAIVDQLIQKYYEENADYANNVDPPTFPDGLCAEVFSFDALKKAWREANLPHHHEHVTPFIRESPSFKKAFLHSPEDLSSFRLTVDTPQDYELIKKLVKLLPEDFTLKDVINVLKKKPELLKINTGLVRDEKYQKQKMEAKK